MLSELSERDKLEISSVSNICILKLSIPHYLMFVLFRLCIFSYLIFYKIQRTK